MGHNIKLSGCDPRGNRRHWCFQLSTRAPLPAAAAFVSTQSGQGVGNLAPFSYFNVMSHNPPHVAIGFAASQLRPHGRKDTLVNILETGWVARAAERCSWVGGAGGRRRPADGCSCSALAPPLPLLSAGDRRAGGVQARSALRSAPAV